LNNSTERTIAGSGGVLLSDLSPFSESEKISTMLDFQYAAMINFEACFAGLRGTHDMAEISEISVGSLFQQSMGQYEKPPS
jgi:hypothetical protein